MCTSFSDARHNTHDLCPFSTDFKHIIYDLVKPGASTGSDFAGDIVEIGKNAEGQGFKIGDAVAGYTRGGFIDPANGTFQGPSSPTCPTSLRSSYIFFTEYFVADPKLVRI